MHVAICDDNETDRKVIIEILRQMKLEEEITSITEYTSGQALLFNLQRTNIDILLLDCRIPVINGIETAKKSGK